MTDGLCVMFVVRGLNTTIIKDIVMSVGRKKRKSWGEILIKSTMKTIKENDN